MLAKADETPIMYYCANYAILSNFKKTTLTTLPLGKQHILAAWDYVLSFSPLSAQCVVLRAMLLNYVVVVVVKILPHLISSGVAASTKQ